MKPYVIVRSYSAGVFAGELVEHDKITRHVTLNNVRRIHYWKGAASLSQLAAEGVTKPESCRFSVETNRHCVAEVIEVIPVTEKARENIAGVPQWKE